MYITTIMSYSKCVAHSDSTSSFQFSLSNRVFAQLILHGTLHLTELICRWCIILAKDSLEMTSGNRIAVNNH